MALKLEINYKGVSANYWKIIHKSEDYSKAYLNTEKLSNSGSINKTILRLGVYKDNIERLNNINNYLYLETVIIDAIDITREETYIKIKELTKFLTAEDC